MFLLRSLISFSRDPEPSLVEPVAAVIHCAPRVELRELHILRDMLAARYSREWVQAAIDNKDDIVGSRVSSRLKIFTPGPELVDLYIAEICKAYDVAFDSPLLQDKAAEAATSSGGGKTAETQQNDTGSGASIGGTLDQTGKQMPPPAEAPTLDPKAAPATHSDASVAKGSGNITTSSGEPNKTLGSKEREKRAFDDLEARFAALKKK